MDDVLFFLSIFRFIRKEVFHFEVEFCIPEIRTVFLDSLIICRLMWCTLSYPVRGAKPRN